MSLPVPRGRLVLGARRLAASDGPRPSPRTGERADDGEADESVLAQTVETLKKNGTSGLPPATVRGTRRTLAQRLREGVLHYWHGSRLLVYETRVSFGLLRKLARGERLIRREQRQLRRTTADLLRLVPFSVFVAVPLLEFALPLFIRLFPNMLPSTFEDEGAANDKIRRQLKVRIETARFLQKAVEAMAADGGSPHARAAAEFAALFDKVRLSGERMETEELAAVCRLFGDGSSLLDNLPRAQLVSLCRFMGVHAFGTDAFLRYQLRARMRRLHADDVLIDSEGVPSLTGAEVQSACQARGIRTLGRGADTLRAELRQWLVLHLRAEVPAVLLILSRAFATVAAGSPTEALQATIQSLPDEAVDEAALRAAEASGSARVSYAQRLAVVQQQQELIADELAQEREAAGSGADESVDDIRRLDEALGVLATESPVDRERRELAELREEREEHREDVEQVTALSKDRLHESRTAARLGAAVERMIGEIEQDLSRFETEMGRRLQRVQPDGQGTVGAEDLARVWNMICKDPGRADRLAEIIARFDEDRDGRVFLADIHRLAQQAEEREGTGMVLEERVEQEEQEQEERANGGKP